ncbi:MAG: hypothetical protein ACJAUV_001380, partial [Flavobacteriales bacterium]
CSAAQLIDTVVISIALILGQEVLAEVALADLVDLEAVALVAEVLAEVGNTVF